MSDANASEPARHWWTDAVIYQIYVRSFADSDGDGIGDLEGVRSRLDHLVELDVDALWINPCYPSPQLDHGYDVADYTDIEPRYGDLGTFDQLVSEAHARRLRVLMDIVPNHCSREHPWFRAALAAPKGSPERARFYFRDGIGANGADPPNNWRAVFGGSAWTPVGDGQWYLGTFTTHQPDWDHTNPEVAELFDDVLRFWFDRGVDGFRVDAVPPVGKAPGLPDAPPVPAGTREVDISHQNPNSYFRPEGHVVWRRWRALLDAYVATHPGSDLMMVAEAYMARRPELMTRFACDDQFHQCFAFDVLLSPWHADSLRDAIATQLDLLRDHGVVPTWTLNNHDVQRIVTRLGRETITSLDAYTGSPLLYPAGAIDLGVGARRARALIGLVLALPGSAYLYQGEELGLPEVLDLPDDRRQDPVFLRTGGAEIGRDGCRVPLPWTADAEGAHGFSPAGASEPWMPQPDDWAKWALDLQRDDPASMFELYRMLLAARRRHAVPSGPTAVVVDLAPEVLAVRRGDLLAVLNPTSRPCHVPALTDSRQLLTTAPDGAGAGTVPPDATVWYRTAST